MLFILFVLYLYNNMVFMCVLFLSGLNPTDQAFYLLVGKLKAKCPKNKQDLKTSGVNA